MRREVDEGEVGEGSESEGGSKVKDSGGTDGM